MPTTEHTMNDALAALLRNTRRLWRGPSVVTSENTGMLKGSSEQPDIMVLEPHVSPVVVETEVLPAGSVEAEALARLGKQVRGTGGDILSAVAVRLPLRLRESQGTELLEQLRKATDIEMALYSGDDAATSTRWPGTGWLVGGIPDLSFLIQSAAIPPSIVEQAAERLVTGVAEATSLLKEFTRDHPGSIKSICRELRQDECDQTLSMAATILANAFVFMETLAGGEGELADVLPLNQLRADIFGLSKRNIVAAWRKILKVNYWPIFDIARRVLEIVPTDYAGPVLERLAGTAEDLLHLRVMSSHDLTGAIFQRLIADRKFLAAFYTTPASAALLTGLAISDRATPSGGSWANAEDVKALRVADFACGTGTLLTTAYRRIGQLYELAGGDAEALHPAMMATGITGCDILPAAAHLTASMLAGAHPTVRYERSSILTVAYGKQPECHTALGSLDLLDPQGRLGILAITARAVESMGEQERDTWQSLPHGSFDLVVMNPPFTRATVHSGVTADTPNPMFGAFGSTPEEQQLMADAFKRLTKGTCAHGNAGVASAFLVLADRKLKTGGVLALVMPLSLTAGDAWEKSRALLARNYQDIIVISIAAAGEDDMSFSADTGMAECLVVARKTGKRARRGTFVVLSRRPGLPVMGEAAAGQIRQMITSKCIRRIEEGPVGGTRIHFGDVLIGHALDAPLPVSGGWNLARIADLSLAQAAYQLTKKGLVWLPTTQLAQAVSVPIATLAAIGGIGPCHRDINGRNMAEHTIRGPFDVTPVRQGGVPTYPVLWAHNAQRQRAMMFEADCEAQPRRAPSPQAQATVDGKVAKVWHTASHCHFNLDFRFNSQSTAMQFTARKSIGGSAWPSVVLASPEQEKALVLWGNTTLGLLLHWWHANKQQSGRGRICRQTLRTLCVLDVTALGPAKLDAAVRIFDDMSSRPLLPVNEIHRDAVRRELDERFGREVLGLPEAVLAPGGPMELLRAKLASEPSIHGQKRPESD